MQKQPAKPTAILRTATRARAVTAAIAAAAMLVPPASALAAQHASKKPASKKPATKKPATKTFSIGVHIPNHSPIVGKRWPIALLITKGHMKLSGSVRYEFLFDKAVVSTEPKHGGFKFSHGVYRDNLVFPSQSLGESLTLRFVVKTRYGTEHADWTFRARKSA